MLYPVYSRYFFNWLKTPDNLTKSLRNIELEKAEVDFISAWLETTAKVTTDKEDLKSRKDSARLRLDKLMQFAEESIDEISDTAIRPNVHPKEEKKSTGFYIYSDFFFFTMFGASLDDEDEISVSHFIEKVTSSDGAAAFILFGVIWLIRLVKRYFFK
ncbi:MAG: hypothetical protein OQJ91_03255 [Motiliproteus sp.]|nr:hypothetical protein [Motiliproteus sp.]